MASLALFLRDFVNMGPPHLYLRVETRSVSSFSDGAGIPRMEPARA